MFFRSLSNTLSEHRRLRARVCVCVCACVCQLLSPPRCQRLCEAVQCMQSLVFAVLDPLELATLNSFVFHVLQLWVCSGASNGCGLHEKTKDATNIKITIKMETWTKGHSEAFKVCF